MWPSLVGHLLIAAVLLKALPPVVGATSTSDAVDVVMVEMPRIGRHEFLRGASASTKVPGTFATTMAKSVRHQSEGARHLSERDRHLRAQAPLPQRRLRNSSRPARGAVSSSTTETPAAGDALRSSSTSRAGHSATIARILARLNRAKRYPAEARRQQLSGHPVVEFTIRRDGTTTAARIITSSGIAILDTAALHTIRRAEPLPYLSDPIQVPIGFEIR